MQLSALSLTTSISYSFHPATDSSTSISLVGELSIPWDAIFLYSSRVVAIPPPVPPRVKEGLIITGSPILSRLDRAFSSDLETNDLGVFNPIFFIALRNLSLSSAFDIASSSAPINSTLCFLRNPELETSNDTFKAV